MDWQSVVAIVIAAGAALCAGRLLLHSRCHETGEQESTGCGGCCGCGHESECGAEVKPQINADARR
ncbi:MAG TPA: hypothetical protein VGP72_17510 [Planctomycetota bacterium]|jgi:hypothetical protein